LVTHNCTCVPEHDAAHVVELKNFLPLLAVPMEPQQTIPVPQSAFCPQANVFAVESIAVHAAALATQLSANPPSVLESQQTGLALVVEQVGPL
jgi:hypothetical protein